MKKFGIFLVLVVLVGCGVLAYRNRDSLSFGTPSPNSKTAPEAAGDTDADANSGDDGDQASPATKAGVPDAPARLTGCDKVDNGSPCHLKGTGFGFNELVQLTFDGTGTPPTTVATDDDGVWQHDLVVLSAPGVVITVHAVGQDSGRRADLTYSLV